MQSPEASARSQRQGQAVWARHPHPSLLLGHTQSLFLWPCLGHLPTGTHVLIPEQHTSHAHTHCHSHTHPHPDTPIHTCTHTPVLAHVLPRALWSPKAATPPGLCGRPPTAPVLCPQSLGTLDSVQLSILPLCPLWASHGALVPMAHTLPASLVQRRHRVQQPGPTPDLLS